MTRPRLLLVEDNIDTTDMLTAFFAAHEFHVLVAHDGETALKLCRSELPSLALMDVGLPDMDGFAVCRELRKMTRTRHLPVIFLTSRTQKEDKIEGLSLGADDFIPKPFDLQELHLRVQNAINRSARSTLTDPRTGLPGMEIVRQEMARAAGQPHRQIVSFRLQNIEPFRDLYGALATTDLLRATALVLNIVLDDLKQPDEFLGQAADDTFVVVCAADKVDGIVKLAVQRFSDNVEQHYSFGRREGDFVHASDAANKEHLLPLLSLVPEFFNP